MVRLQINLLYKNLINKVLCCGRKSWAWFQHRPKLNASKYEVRTDEALFIHCRAKHRVRPFAYRIELWSKIELSLKSFTISQQKN